jgi:solute carrier family 39 (zinc transporter), member 1/2/3
MEIHHYQLIFIAAILATGLFAGLTPALTGAAGRYERFFSLGNALGGGVFLGAGLIHLLPDAIDNFSGLLGPDFDYPLASLICAAGFLLILLIEKVIVGGDEERLAAEASRSDDAMLPYVLALVLSVHSLIAGMALGAESQLATSVALFIAIIAHKGVAAFALGVSLERGAVRRSRSIGIVTLFSVMTPLGILAGAGLGALLSGAAEHWFEGTFDALAAGTFLYVAVVDIIGGEFSLRKDLWAKFMMVLTGLALMALVAVWT